MPPSTSDDGSEQTIQHVIDDYVWRRQGKIVAAAGNVLRRPIHRRRSGAAHSSAGSEILQKSAARN